MNELGVIFLILELCAPLPLPPPPPVVVDRTYDAFYIIGAAILLGILITVSLTVTIKKVIKRRGRKFNVVPTLNQESMRKYEIKIQEIPSLSPRKQIMAIQVRSAVEEEEVVGLSGRNLIDLESAVCYDI